MPGTQRRVVNPMGNYVANKQAAIQAQHDAPPRSLFEQIGGVFTNLPQGLISLGSAAARSAIAPMRSVYDLATGNGSVADVVASNLPAFGAPGIAPGAMASTQMSQDARNKYLPLQQQFYRSGEQTVGNIAHPSRYARAVRDGTIVDTVLNDAANIAMVGGAAGKLFGALPAAADAAAVAEQAARGAAEAATITRTAAEARAAAGGFPPPFSPPGTGGFAPPTGAGIARPPVMSVPLARGGLIDALRAAEGAAGQVKHFAERTANAPFTVANRGLKLAGGGSAMLRDSALGDWAAQHAPFASGGLPAVGEKWAGMADTTTRGRLGRSMRQVAPMRMTAEGQAFRPAVRAASQASMRAEAAATKVLREFTDMNAMTIEEQGVATALRSGIAHDFEQALNAGKTVAEARDAIATRNIPEQTLTYETAQVLADYLAGKMDPARMTVIDKYGEAVGKLLDGPKGQTERALTGVGRSKPMDPRFLGDQVLLDRVETQLLEAGVDASKLPNGLLEGLINRDAAAIAENAALANPVDLQVLSNILDNPGVWPKAWRPSMRAAGLRRVTFVEDATAQAQADIVALKAAKASKADVAAAKANLAAVEAQATADARRTIALRPSDKMLTGQERPGYVSSARSDLADPRSVGTGRQPLRDGSPGLRGVTSENFSAQSGIMPMSARTMAEAIGKEAGRTTMNQAVTDMMQHPALRTVEELLPQAVRDDLMRGAQREAKAALGSPGQIKQATKKFYGMAVTDALKQAGFEPLIGDLAAPEVGAFNPDSRVPYHEITDATVALPQGLKDALVPNVSTKDMNVILRGLSKVNSKWKGNVLPFSVRWQMGDVVGGAFMSMVGGGIPPWELIKGMRAMRKLSPEAVQAIIDHPDLQSGSLTMGEVKFKHRGPDAPGPRTPIGKLKEMSFKLNGKIVDLNRHGYVLAKLQRLLEAKGLNLDSAEANALWDHPDVQQAITAAVEDANKVMGTFDEMTPFERRVVKEIFPFWLWNRHITQLAWRTATDNPARMMWTLRIGSYGTDPEANLPPWLAGSIPFGDQLLPTNFLNPFNDVGGGNIYTPEGALRAMSPGIKLAAAAGLGADLNNGGTQFTRPYGSGNVDALGRDTFTPMFGNPGELAYQGLRQIPFTREMMNLLPTAEVGGVGLGPHPRYGNGAMMVDRYGHPIDSNTRWKNAGGLISLPWPTDQADVAQLQGAEAKRRRLRAQRAAKVVGFGG